MRKKIFFFFWSDEKFFTFFFVRSNSFDEKRSTTYDILLVDKVSVGLALKLASLGADKPPANNS